jgi:adenylate cyclase
VFEIDEFHGANAGLVVAEVELAREGQEIPHPDWLGEELTDDPRFLNASLALRPWSQWGAEESDALGAAAARSAGAARQARE